MSKGVTGPLLITGVVVAVGNGWIISAWNWIYTAVHTGGSTNPFVSSSGPLSPVTVGKGGDLATGGLTGLPQISITGTINGSTFTPNDSKIAPFKIGPSTNEIPTSVLQSVYKLFGTAPSSGGSNGVTVW